MTKSRRGKLYIDDAGWGPDAGSIEYGYRVPFDGIHIFIGRIGEPGPEPDSGTDLIETAQRARNTRAQPVMKRAFVGCIHEGELSKGSEGDGEPSVLSDVDSSAAQQIRYTKCKTACLGAVPMAPVFRTSMSRQDGQESSWLGLNPVKALQPLLQLRPGWERPGQ